MSPLKKFLLKILLGLAQIVLVGGAAYLSFEWLMNSMVHSRKEIVVPALTGKTLREAASELSKVRLALSLEGEEYAPEQAVGTVVKQYPAPGSKVREGKIIAVFASIGSEKISVPEVTGLPLRKAEIEIKAARLALGEIAENYSLRQPKGYILEQDPKSMELAEKGDLVHLAISLGEPPQGKLIIPDFVGEDLEKATDWTQRHQATLLVKEDWTRSDEPNGKVLKQNLKPDTLFEKEILKEEGLALEITVARRKTSALGRFLEYTIPDKPIRKRELILKAISKGAEREVFRTTALPGDTVNIPLPESLNSLRVRVYLDGIFTEERKLK